MKHILIINLLLLTIYVNAQTKILFTSIDYAAGEVRANICDENGNNRHDLGFNKTYLPVWFGDKILLNSDNFLWQCDTSGENFKQLFLGYRASVSNDRKKFAFYNSDGIGIADENGEFIKQISVNTLNDAAITWSKDDGRISYFDPEKQKCFLFHLGNDSLEVFGDSIFHPLWNPVSNSVLYNKAALNGKYSVVVYNEKTNIIAIINSPSENAVVPIWSSKGDKIAYLSFRNEIEDTVETDLYPCNLTLYDFSTQKSKVLTEDAGFTDRAFPQMCFDEDDGYIYYTQINELGLGSITRVNLNNFHKETISKDIRIDERFPHVKTFK